MKFESQSFPNRFNRAEFTITEQIWQDGQCHQGLSSDGIHNPSFRQVNELHVTHSSLTDSLRALFEEANAVYQVDISEHIELRLLQYRGDQGGRCDLHQDSLWTTPIDRKLTAIIALNAPYEYLGGEFYCEGMAPRKLELGEALVFPGFMQHGITPVTRGTRMVLLAWQYGKAWK